MIEVRDYSSRVQDDLCHTINADFEVGKLNLFDRRLLVISKDGCYLTIYNLDEANKTLSPAQKFVRGQTSCVIYDPV